MSPLPIPVDFSPPTIVETRSHDIDRTAAELCARAAYANAFIKKANNYKWQLLHCANFSEMSDAAFRLFFTYIAYAKEDGTGIFPGQKTVSSVMRRSARSVGRAGEELAEDGWIATKRQRRGPAAKIASIPAHISQAIVKEILEATNLSDQETPIEVPDFRRPRLSAPQEAPKVTSLNKEQEATNVSPINASKVSFLKSQEMTNLSDSTKFENLEATDSPLRPDKSVAQNQKIEPKGEYYNKTNTNTPRAREEAQPSPQTVPDPATELVEGDFYDYNLLFNSWGRKPNDITPRIPHRRDFTDANLRGVLRGQAHRDQKLAISAIRSTVTSMQSRTVLSAADRAVFGSGGFGAYFQKVLIDTLDQLERSRLTAGERQRCATGGTGNLPIREADYPEEAWQAKLKRYLAKGKITQEEAVSAGLRL